MKKIIILNGAGKKNGSTATMVKAFADAVCPPVSQEGITRYCEEMGLL